ncbi:copper amine oxidase N-terminal domain-containing protein [Brevibacillus ruminantium]|uniref:Copper amine oxidase N-terminal domain-containing protein n=1 Tax=Brevibacillus ruminantium TaxID=2950604 RepID=A0ABY4WF96_9BACL|nr:stalk domain-containing protein [Brevibacillus ruminantium]USG65833.1 copper amine oxidase N-terminal domain-containing protein [Brevibacillus ruminantium]
MHISKRVLIGSLAGALLFTGGMLAGSNSAVAKKAAESIRVNFANIKLIANGKEIQNKAEPFTYNGNVYVPAATIANMFGIAQTWDNSTPAVRFESADRVASAPQYAGMQGQQNYPHPLDYVYALRPKFEKVVNIVNNKELVIPKMENDGTLTPISRMVHADMFYMLETNSQGTFINGYQIDKVKIEISKLFSRKIEPVTGSLSFNEETREFTEKMLNLDSNNNLKLVGIKIYGISDENVITKKHELLTQ